MKSAVLKFSESSDFRKMTDISELSDHQNLAQMHRNPESQKLRHSRHLSQKFQTTRMSFRYAENQTFQISTQNFQITRISLRYAENQNYRTSDIPDIHLRTFRSPEFLSDMQKIRTTKHQTFQISISELSDIQKLRTTENQITRNSDLQTIRYFENSQTTRNSDFVKSRSSLGQSPDKFQIKGMRTEGQRLA